MFEEGGEKYGRRRSHASTDRERNHEAERRTSGEVLRGKRYRPYKDRCHSAFYLL